MKRTAFCLTLLLIFIGNFSFGSEPEDFVKDLVFSYFEEIYNVPRSDIQIEFIRSPQIDSDSENEYQFKIESRQNKVDLGYQTIWLMVFKDNCFIEKYPITIDLSIYKETVVTCERLKRGELITEDILELKRVKLDRDYYNVISNVDEAVGLISKQIIDKGEVLRKTFLKPPVDVHKGDNVKVYIVSGALTIVTQGRVRSEGIVGDIVDVICEPTREVISGTVKSSEVVEVRLK